MGRIFVGTGYSAPVRYDVHIEEAGSQRSFTQQIRGAPTNYRWDGAGPGSNDLARALLWVTTGVEPAWSMYHQFKSEVVSTWPRQEGECWRISGDEISQWLAGVERDTAATEDAGQTQSRQAQTHARELKLEGFAAHIRRRG